MARAAHAPAAPRVHQRGQVTLRQRLLATTLAVAVPLTVALYFVAERYRSGGMEDSMERYLSAELGGGIISRCEAEGGLPASPSPRGGRGGQGRGGPDGGAIVDRVVARLTPLARAAGVEVNFAVPEGGMFVDADPTLVEQAISNLVDNAVRYNRPGGHVAVVLDRTDTQGGFRLTVADDGPGVKSNELPHLATRRFRGDAARSRRPDGQGIGLAIVAEAMSRCGWTLRFRANEPSGLVAAIRNG